MGGGSMVIEKHVVKSVPGSDARNHTVICVCGWAFASTYRAIRDRGEVHTAIFVNEQRRWNDPKRQTEMPLYLQRTPAAGSRSAAGQPASRA